MLSFTIRRLIGSVFVLLASSFLVFSLCAASFDPLARYYTLQPRPPEAFFDNLREELGLNDNFFIRYWNWLTGVVTGDFGETINGTPVITPGAGTIQVHVDNDGVATAVTSRTRIVDDLTEHGSHGPLREPAPPGAAAAQAGESQDPDRLLAKVFSDRLRRLAASGGDMPTGFAVVPGTTEVGYDVDGDSASLVAQREVELDFGGGIKKRYLLKARI